MKDKNALVIEVEHGTEFPEYYLNLFSFGLVKKVFLREVTSEYRTQLFDLVLYTCDCVNEAQLRWLLPLAKQNPNTQFIVLAKNISIHAYRQVAAMNNLVTIQLPINDELIASILPEILKKNSLPTYQRFPRFITNEPVRMVVMETGLLIPSRMRNYSVGGAFIEYKGISLRAGHTLKINLPDQENPPSNKSLQLNGKVVWVREDLGKSGSTCGVGVRFLDLQ